MSDRAARHLLVRGWVQGVGYRAWTERTAVELGLSGWVRNLHDGRVEIYAEGDPASLEALSARCERGPISARVEGVERRSVEPRGFDGFEMRKTVDDPESL